MSFVHLHSHTSYSLLDGAGNITKMIREAVRLNMPALAITDHGNMFGSLEFYTAAKKAGIKPIIGCEAYVAPGDRKYHRQMEGESHSYHLVLLAKNETGYRNLIKLTSASYLEGFYYKPRIDRQLLREHSEGLIVLSACMKGEIAYKLRRDRKREATEIAEYYLDLFGDDFYFEIQDHGIPEEHATYPHIYELAREMGVPVVATNDVHYLYKKDHMAHDVLLCLQTGKDRDDPNRLRYNTQELYMKSAEEMFALFKDKPDVLERTLEIAEKINLDISFGGHLLPKFPIPASEGNISEYEYLEKLSRKGLEKKYGNITKEMIGRLEYELGVINKMGFAGYFLIVQDFINAARERDIPVGLGRGSAAGSLVAYTLGITNVDPLRYGLLFERFLNPDRISMPDIDIDFCYERRDQVIEYVRDKYGRKNVAQIITFGTMGPKSVIRDVGRVIKVPLAKCDAIAKQIPNVGAKPMALEKAFKKVPELKEIAESEDSSLKELTEYSQTLEGQPRHTSIHAAGIIIAPDDITNYAPLYMTSEKEIATQWTMGWCEKIGLLKMDFLGLRNLTVIHNSEEMIRARHDRNFSIEKIPQDDSATFKLFSEGHTVGVFQFESSGMQEYLRKLQPTRVEDLIAMNALYRPGPMKFIDDFIDRKKGKKEIIYPHEKLKPILEETYGIIVYQEQVMRISSDLAGFTMSEADTMRRIMGKKKVEEMVAQKEKFVGGCLKNGIDKKVANEVADMIEKFAQYGFNKSHSAAYALIAYQTAYLKAHYPAEFMAANLTSEVNDANRVQLLMNDCRRMGLEVVPPDVNHSKARFEPIDDKRIAFGMAAIKNVGTGAIESIVKGREKVGKYETIFQLMQTVDPGQVNKKVLESLAQCGALDSLEGSRAQLFSAIEPAIEFAQSYHERKKRNAGQKSLFEFAGSDDEMITYPSLPEVPDWSPQEKLKKEKELIGMYVTGHPLQKFAALVTLYRTPIERLNGNGSLENRWVNLCGMITEIRTMYDRKQNKMAFIKLEDFERTYEAVVFGSVYPQLESVLQADAIVLLRGRLNSDSADPVPKIICEEAYELEKAPSRLTESLHLRIEKDRLTEENITYLKNLLITHPGKLPIFVNVKTNGSEDVRMVSKTVRVQVDAGLINELEKILTLENIKVKVRER